MISEKAIWDIASHVVKGLDTIHHQLQTTVIHRNIKPSNIFFDNETNMAKIGDFAHIATLEAENDFAKTLNKNTYYLSP